MKRDDGFGAAVLAAFIIVSVVVIFMAAIKSCNEDSGAGASQSAEHIESSVVVAAVPSSRVDTEPESLGEFRLTVYTPHESSWGRATATGRESQHLATCAVDPKIIPYGTILTVGGELTLWAVDCGDFSGRMIDIFYDGDIRDAMAWLNGTFGDYADVTIR